MQEVLININSFQTRVALLENNKLREIYIERSSNLELVGNIYKGKISRVLPGMQAAFVDIGLEKAAFLHASDLSEGKEIVVQVIKNPLDLKGAKVTTQLSISSRYLVFMPQLGLEQELDHIGVSLKIEDEVERDRLKQLFINNSVDFNDFKGKIIIRTAAEGAMNLEEDKYYLRKLWQEIQKKIKNSKPGDKIHTDLGLILRVFRDIASNKIDRVRIDSKFTTDNVIKFIKNYKINISCNIECYMEEKPIFDLYNIDSEIEKALQRKVQLKSGGYIVFDQTEALTTIDVNTGSFVGKNNLEKTVFATNMEAATIIAHQIRLRNLGGIIIIDFIDMLKEEHKCKIIKILENNLSNDNVKTKLSSVSELGLVQMTRKRTRKSLEYCLCEACPICNGRGTVKTVETICLEIFLEINKLAKTYETKSLMILASQSVVDYLLNEGASILAELEANTDKYIKLQVDGLYNQEQYDVVLL